MAKRVVDISALHEDALLCGEAEEILMDWLRRHITLAIVFDVNTQAWHHTATLEVEG